MKKIIFATSLLAIVMICFNFEYAYTQSVNRNPLSALIENAKLHHNFMGTAPFATLSYPKVNEYAEHALALEVDKSEISKLLAANHYAIDVSIPMYDGSTTHLELVQSQLGNFDVVEKNGTLTHTLGYKAGLHYRGVVRGEGHSLAAVSIFDDRIIILFSTEVGTYNLGKLEDNTGYYILYNDKDLKFANPLDCKTNDNFDSNINTYETEKGGGNTVMANCKVVKCYYEADFAMYQAFGSNTTSTANYVTAIFNQKSTLYANDGVSIEISQIVVWTATDPYASNTSTSTTNNAFISYVGTNFTGDIANLLSTRSLGGGIAQGFSGLCNKAEAHCTSQIYTTYSTVPTYSWTVMVITHEMGHLMGSRHTHACVWNGNNTAIDGCSGATEGGCPLPGYPANGGTIMSYCHLQNVGINFSNGFGPQPAAVITGNIAAANCLTGSSATTPTGLTTSSITSNSATLSWNTSLGATDYNVEYKASTSSVWLPLGTYQTNTATLPGLIPNTTYNWHVNADCSAFSAQETFTTTGLIGCDIATGLGATNITINSAKLTWSAWSGASNYRVRYRKVGTTLWTVKSTTTAYKVVTLLDTAANYEFQVATKCGTVLKPYSAKAYFTTKNITPPNTYCAANGLSTTYEYINSVAFGSINNVSGNNNGYADYTALKTIGTMGTTYTLTVVLTKAIATDVEYVTVWIDYNRDGDFNDAGEQVLAKNTAGTNVSGSVKIPLNAALGQTRMRVSMQYSAAPPVCGTFTYGEVEDYVVDIKTLAPPPRESADITDVASFTLSPNPVSNELTINFNEPIDRLLSIEVINMTGKLCLKDNLNANGELNVSKLPTGIYFIKVYNGDENFAVQKFIKR